MPETWIWVGRDVAEAITGWSKTFDEEGVVFRDRVRKGDRILWWKSGRGAGLYGDGVVSGEPILAGFAGWHKREYRFRVTVLSRYPGAPLLKEALLTDPGLRLLVKRLQQQRPNPREVTPSEWRSLHRLLTAPRFQTAVIQRVGAGFGDPTSNKTVERSAIAFVTRRYRQAGWTVNSVEGAKCGYDLVCIRGEDILHLEVKGSSGSGGSFILTAGELAASRVDPLFQLAFVASATSTPRLYEYSGKQLSQRFDTLPVTYMCRPKRRVAG